MSIEVSCDSCSTKFVIYEYEGLRRIRHGWMKRLGYKKIEVAEIFDGIDHGNYCMTDIGAVGDKHKSIRQIPWKIQRFDDPLEYFLRKSCREEGNKNIDRELQQYFSKLAICCAECKLLAWFGLSSRDDEMCFVNEKEPDSFDEILIL